MSIKVLLKEQNLNSQEIVYVKQAENTIMSMNASLNPRNSVTYSIFKDILLPQGYPESVSEDYLVYQLWDTLQAFCSTVTNTLATRAVLQGIGVGDQAASSISAAITWVMKDGVGMIARIVFAWICGSRLDRECKKWRLFADILNDIAICIELFLLPYFVDLSLLILCLSTSIKAIVGVAGGATRASITQHQAKNNNMADVSAKDGSQETCVNLVASVVGIILLSLMGNSRTTIWFVFFLLTGLHLYANFRAVKSLNINKFNSERLNYVLKEFLVRGKIASSAETNNMESVIPFTDTNSSRKICGYDIKIGHSIQKLTGEGSIYPFELQLLTHLYNGRKYMIVVHWKHKVIYILLDENYCYADVLEAYFHAFVLGLLISFVMKKKLDLLRDSLVSRGNSLVKELMKNVETYKKKDRFRVDVDFFMSVDTAVSKEYNGFAEALKKSDWSMTETYLPVCDWRATWKNLSVNSKCFTE